MPPPSRHPPYPPTTASLGGVPTVGLDIPITAVFLVLFILGAVGHMTIFQLNRKRGHKFIMSGMLFGFCMARITTCVMRIVWATRPTQLRVAMAAQIFVSAGVVLLFVINLIFAQRIVRASHPHTGWHPFFAKAFVLIYVLIVLVLAMLITALVQSFYTLNAHTKHIDRSIVLFGQTFNTFIAFLPILLVIGGLVIPRRTRVEKFGNGRFRSKIFILMFSAVILTLGAAFRAGTNFITPRPRADPAWYHSKACFYTFDFLIEWVVVVFYMALRVDLRFHVPNGSKGAGDYSAVLKKVVTGKGEGRVATRVLTEGEVYDEESEPELRTPTLKDETKV